MRAAKREASRADCPGARVEKSGDNPCSTCTSQLSYCPPRNLRLAAQPPCSSCAGLWWVTSDWLRVTPTDRQRTPLLRRLTWTLPFSGCTHAIRLHTCDFTCDFHHHTAEHARRSSHTGDQTPDQILSGRHLGKNTLNWHFRGLGELS